MPSSVSAVGFHDLPSIRRLAPGFVVVVWVLPLGCRLAAITRPNRVRFSTGRWFTSGCSPPPLAGTQLPSVTNLRTRSEGDSHSSDSVHFPSHTPASKLAGVDQRVAEGDAASLQLVVWGGCKKLHGSAAMAARRENAGRQVTTVRRNPCHLLSSVGIRCHPLAVSCHGGVPGG